jgi:putative RNA 2'-phosphotransferase
MINQVEIVSKNNEKISKFLSLVLRHKPDEIGLVLDAQGWANIAQLIALSNEVGYRLDEALIVQIVAESDKQRFSISDDGLRIRANQGHSIAVDLELAPITPPQYLLHGTASRFLNSIMTKGLSRMSRQHVHLSENADTALRVGARYGEAVLLRVDSNAMVEAGHLFFRSDNGVWLVDSVPPKYISLA